MKKYLLPTLASLAYSCFLPAGHVQITLNPISSVRNGSAEEVFDESAAEIVDYDVHTQ